MKICGVTFVRNAIKYQYPIVATINSILPIVNEFIVNVGESEDETLQLIQSIKSDKIKIIHSIWDDNLREGGKVLAIETNKALDAVSSDSDWLFYIQGDEVIHEQYLEEIKNQCQNYLQNTKVEGLLFDYTHFYGSYDYIGDSRKWYQKEIRIIRNDKNIRSYKDAQGFRKNDKKLKVKSIKASVYHYGWVKHPEAQKAKEQNFNKHWHNDEWMKENIKATDSFDYSDIDSIQKFKGTHPKVMQSFINEMNWNLNLDTSKKRFTFKDKILYYIEKWTGKRLFEYKNYEII